jgi:epsilon-lactone hydrolase
VRAHRKLRHAGVEAVLEVFEGISHGQYLVADAPETKEALAEISRFFDGHLGR